ncbi:MAG: ABC transporter permease [Acidobacteriota bacterium]|jgi:putative ABC transport system permease protein|nr:ABC transporter permease [Acidobacteriota bacterium]
MTSFSFLRQMAQDVRHQKLRTLLTLLGITWGTISVALLVAFGEGLEAQVRKSQHGLGEGIVIAWAARTSMPYQGLGKGRPIRVSEEDLEALRQELPDVKFAGEYGRGGTFRRERVRISPGMTASNPVFGAMRNLVPAAGGRYVNDLDIDRKRRVTFLGNKLKEDLFGDEDAVGQTVMIDNVPFLVVGVMQKKAQDSSYGGRDEGKAFIPDTTFKGLYGNRYVDNFIFQASHPSLVPEVTRRVYEILGRRLKFDPDDKEALHLWDTTEGEKFFSAFFLTFRMFLAVIGSFTLMVGGIGVSNIMSVVVEERTPEIGVKLAVGAKPRFIQGQFLAETLLLTAVGGGLGLLFTFGVLAVFPLLGLGDYIGTPAASPVVVLTTAGLLGLIGLVAGYFPARRASLLDPVAALKLS